MPLMIPVMAHQPVRTMPETIHCCTTRTGSKCSIAIAI